MHVDSGPSSRGKEVVKACHPRERVETELKLSYFASYLVGT